MQGIPKRIHYIWFGKGEKSDLIKKCQESSRRILSDWEIIEWNEENYDINSCEYMEEAYNQKKYAFASDYARFDLLYRYGGVYLDTDVELLKPISDSMLNCAGFTGIESNNKIAPGLVFACEPGNPIVGEIIKMYQSEHFIDPNGQINMRTVVDRVTEVFYRHGFQRNGLEQILEGFHIYPAEYFCAYDFVTAEFTITDKTISIHHYTATWIDSKSRIKGYIKTFLRKSLGKDRYKKLIGIKRRFFGVNGE